MRSSRNILRNVPKVKRFSWAAIPTTVFYPSVVNAGEDNLRCCCFADSGKRKKKGSELEQIDCTPPEHILPGSKERPLVPLQPQNKDWKVGPGPMATLLPSTA